LPLRDATWLFERYQLKNCLGANGAKQTWLAEDGKTHTKVTIKALYFGQGMEWQDLKLFEREVQTLKSLAHPRIPYYQDSFWLEQPEGNYFCLVQNYILGASLAEKINAGWRLEAAEVERVATSILEILVYLHKQNPPVIHRDIKPNNLIWGEDNQIYLVDFGAVQAEVMAGRTTTVVGTYGYMPPEQFGGRTVPASDLYGLGTTLLFLLIGMNPADLPQKDLKIQFQERAQLAQPLKRWLEHMVEPSLEKRFQDANEALTFLKKRNSLLSSTMTQGYSDKPMGTLVQLECNSEQLNIEIPGRAFNRSDIVTRAQKSLLFALFSSGALIAWLVFRISIFPTHLGVIAAALTLVAAVIYPTLALFLFFLLLLSLWPVLVRTRIHLTRNTYEIIWDIKGLFPRHVKGLTKDLAVELKSKYKLSRHSAYGWQGKVEEGEQRVCLLKSNMKKYSFGLGLDPDEQEWLVREIEGWLESARIDSDRP
jgi:serine/threonine protein kinase